jgi:hypothetical protein
MAQQGALKGDLGDFSLPDVFQLIQLSRKTGVLRITRESAEGTIWFREGDVFFATSDWRRELLGQRLVAEGRITANALKRALALRQAEPAGGRRLGTILVDEGYLTQATLETFVQEQIQDTIFDLMRWDDGAFYFEALAGVPADEDIGLSVSVENIVMEGSRRLDEWNRIRRKIPSMDMVFRMSTLPGQGTYEISLKPTEWKLLLALDGGRTVAELAEETGRTDFEAARSLYGLYSAGLLELADDESVAAARAEREVRGVRLADVRAAAPPASAPGPVAATRIAEAPLARPAGAEEPAFLTTPATPGDAAVFEELIGATLGEAPSPAQADEAPPAAEVSHGEEPEPIVEPELQPEPEPEPEPESEPEPQPESEPETQPEPESIAEPEPISEPWAAEPPQAPDAALGEVDIVAVPPEPTRHAGEAVALAAETPSEAEAPPASPVEELETLAARTAGEVEDVIGPAGDEFEEGGTSLAPPPPYMLEETLAAPTPVPAVESESPVPAAPLPEAGPESPPAEQPAAPPSPESAAAVQEPVTGARAIGELPDEIFTADVELARSGVLGDELTALTGADPFGRRPQAPAAPVPASPQNAPRIRRDTRVDRTTVEQIIRGLENL